MEIDTGPAQGTPVPLSAIASKKPKFSSKNKQERMTISKTKGQASEKGNLESILQAIDTEKYPVVWVVDVGGIRKKKKVITTKKLDFTGEDVEFVFQSRKPLTRSQLAKDVMPQAIDKGKQPLIQEIIDLSPVKEVITMQRKGKEKVVEK